MFGALNTIIDRIDYLQPGEYLHVDADLFFNLVEEEQRKRNRDLNKPISSVMNVSVSDVLKKYGLDEYIEKPKSIMADLLNLLAEWNVHYEFIKYERYVIFQKEGRSYNRYETTQYDSIVTSNEYYDFNGRRVQ